MELYIKNQRGDVLDLLNNDFFTISHVEGLTTAANELATVDIGYTDGDDVTQVKTQPRSMVFDLRIKTGVDVDTALRNIMHVLKSKKTVTVYWTHHIFKKNIVGIVESVDVPRFTDEVIAQITIYCSKPYWEDVDFVIEKINNALSFHYFTEYPNDMLIFIAAGQPFGTYNTESSRRVYNGGDVDAGLYMEVSALSQIVNPIITNLNGDFFGVGYGTSTHKVTLNSGDVLTITTHKGNKTVKINGVSVIDKIKPLSKWLQLEPGDDVLSISDDTGTQNMIFYVNYKQRYV